MFTKFLKTNSLASKLILVLGLLAILGVAGCGPSGNSTNGTGGENGSCGQVAGENNIDVGQAYTGGTYAIQTNIPGDYVNWDSSTENFSASNNGLIVDLGATCFGSVTAWPGGGHNTVAVITNDVYIVQFPDGTYFLLQPLQFNNGVLLVATAPGTGI